MSYNILNKNVQFQGPTQGTIEDIVDDHSDQTIDGQKTFSNLSASSDVSVVGNVSASLNISASNFYANGVLVDPSGGGTITALNNQAANRLVTIGATTTELDGEANLTFDGSVFDFNASSISGSGNISGSAFYGDGSNLDNVNAETVTLAAGSGLQNSSGLLVDPSQSTAIVGSINDSDNVTVYSTADSAPRKVTVADIAGRATVPISTYTNVGAGANRVIVSIDGSGVKAQSNLTFDNSDLSLTGNLSGSGNLQLGGTVRMDGMTSLADPIQVTNDEIMLIDDSSNLVSKVSFASFCGSIAGDGISENTGRLEIQVSDFLASGSNNRIITAVDANTMNAEESFTFDGTTLILTGSSILSGSTATFDTTQFTIQSATTTKPTLELKNTTPSDSANGPILVFTKHPSDNTGTVDNDVVGMYRFNGIDDGGNATTYAQLFTRAVETQNGSEGGEMDFQVSTGGSLESIFTVQGARIDFSIPCEIIVNEAGIDCNLRVESNVNSNAFFIDGTDGHVALGDQADSGVLLLLSGSNDEYLFQAKQQGNGYPSMFLAGESHASYPEVFYNRGKFVNVGSITQGNLAGEGGSHSRLTIKKTSITDNSATDIVTFTIPNANHAASIRVTGLANFDGCSYAQVFSFEGVIARSSGSPTDKAFSSVSTTQSAGVTPNFTVAVAGSSNTGANTAQQTFTMQLTIDTSDSSTSNATIMIELINFNDSGITMAAS